MTQPNQKKQAFTNRLAQETSPYLLQHAHNPVAWYPWGEEAFAKAKQEDKPIFLSVGYSACHWCHVMEHECFEDEATAKILNDGFVSIKVDREERPDVDDIYMRYVHMTQQSGGWPMSIFMTPQGVPFFGGTYFPREHFQQLLTHLSKAWKEERPKIDELCAKTAAAMQNEAEAGYRDPERPLSPETVTRSLEQLEQHFDFQNGGVQSSRKFPPHTTLEMLLQVLGREPGNASARKMLKLTLDKMQLGGIHDHLAGGFHRYATDPVWFLPHFEKMLYDNAQLARCFARAAVVLQDEEYSRTARGIYEWVLRDMTSPQGAFYSALDADSEGVEGKFYVWDYKEVEKVLGPDSVRFCELYNLRPGGNYREEATREPSGLNIPHLTATWAEHAQRLGVEESKLRDQAGEWRNKLLAVRVKRVWPHKDDKILTAWNALMVGSLAQGAIYLKEPRYRDAAVKAAEWLLKQMRTPDGRWLATHREGQSKLPAYLDDHAYLAQAFLDLCEATGEVRWKEEAAAVIKLMNEHFWDSKKGGYFFVADDHETLLVRLKNPTDNATPSGNGIAAQALVRLANLTGDKTYQDRAQKLFATFHALLDLAPIQVESLLLALKVSLDKGGIQEPATPALELQSRPKIQRGPVIAELIVGKSKLRAGQKTPIAVRLTMDTGYHVQAHQPSSADYIPTRFSLSSKALGALSGEKYPAPQKLKTPELGGELLVYSQEVVFGGWLEVPQEMTLGPQTLKVEVEFQACNERACQRPEKVELFVLIDVVSGSAQVEDRNKESFKKLQLDE